MEEKKEYKYDAFISYRHCELDKFVATNLHRILETYELPKEVKKKLGIKSKAFKRVFRDQEELPLTSNLEDPIIDALNNSKYLIVICSPRLNKSLWCKKEIETFKKIRGRKNIFCVLIEGEPSDSFPEEVLYDDDGKTMVEPLAADVRGKNHREVLNKLKVEKLRLIAPMYNLDFDDLRQRHKIWKQKRIIHTVLGITIASILFMIYSIAMFIKIQLQQNVLSEYHAKALAEQAEGYLNKDSRSNAIKLSYQALTNFENIKMPYTTEAEYMLSESLGLYDVGFSYKATSELETDGVADYILISPNYKYGLVHDGSEKLTLFNAKTLEKIKVYNTYSSYNKFRFSFVGEEMLAFINEKGNINLVSTKDGKVIKEIEKIDDTYKAVQGDNEAKYLSYIDNKTLYIYDVSKEKEINKISLTKEKYINEMYYSYENEYLFVGTIDAHDDFNFNFDKEDAITIHTIRLKDGKEINKVDTTAGYISEIITRDDNVYLLLNQSTGASYNMLVMSYDFMNGKVNWTKAFEKKWGKLMTRSFEKNTNNLAVVSYDTVGVIDGNTGNLIHSFNSSSEIIDIFSYINEEIYLVFTDTGHGSYINMKYKNNVEYGDRYEFNLDKYSKVAVTENGFILVPNNENRIILYDKKVSDGIKEVDIKLDLPEDDSIPTKDYDTVKEEYNLKNKSLVTKIFYDTDKEVMFVNYNNGDIAIYNVKDKKLINTLEKTGKINHYFGKDKENRIYIGDLSDSYILDENYNKVGHIKRLRKLEDDKIIIGENDKYYETKIYYLKDLKEEAKKYLDERKLLED